MSKTMAANLLRISETAKYWDNIVKGTGFKLYGFTGTTRANFYTPDGKRVIELNSDYLELINALIENQPNEE